MQDYEYHIFLSYRRSDEDWVNWTRENFVRALRSLLRPSLGDVKIFVDESIETNASWPQSLAVSLSRSRLMVAILSRDYFQSEWCRLELALMHDREKRSQLRTFDNPAGLIIPVVIDDGECFPEEVQEMQSERMHDFANPFMQRNSPKQEAMAEFLKNNVCPTILNALKVVPKYDAQWGDNTYEHFKNMFKIQTQKQSTVPSLELPKLP